MTYADTRGRSMTRAEFLDRLRLGLRGMPKASAEDIISDYEGHFTDGMAAGRTEQEVASALGDPARLARELRAEAGLKQWEERRSPGSAATAVFAILGLGAIDFLFLLPILSVVIFVIFIAYIGVVGVFFAGVAAFTVSVFGLEAGGLFAGIGMMAGSASIGALVTLVSIALVNALVWYGRLHIKVVTPALNQGEQ